MTLHGKYARANYNIANVKKDLNVLFCSYYVYLLQSKYISGILWKITTCY